MRRRFALDQNFPEPIVDALSTWLEAELVPIRRIDQRMPTLDDWRCSWRFMSRPSGMG